MKAFLLISALFILSLSACTAQAQEQSKFIEGEHYEIVSEKKSEQPNVTEFFSLFCGHCFQFEPFMDSLQNTLPNGVHFKKSHVDYIPRDNEPVSFGIVKAFIVMGDLGKEKELTKTFFAAIHLAQENIDTEAKIRKLFVDNGIDGVEFDKLYNSQSVKDRATAMAELWVTREISSVPTIVVNDKYKVNMAAMKSMEDLVQITEYLLKQK